MENCFTINYNRLNVVHLRLMEQSIHILQEYLNVCHLCSVVLCVEKCFKCYFYLHYTQMFQRVWSYGFTGTGQSQTCEGTLFYCIV